VEITHLNCHDPNKGIIGRKLKRRKILQRSLKLGSDENGQDKRDSYVYNKDSSISPNVENVMN
jgi:hypothetical protein